jgi:hypothetical protein
MATTGHAVLWTFTYEIRLPPPRGDNYLCRQIVAATARVAGLSVADFMRLCRKPGVNRLRQSAAWLMRGRTGFSTLRIGDVLERDHSTVIYAVRQVAACPVRFQPLVDAICRELGWQPVAIAS